MNNGQKEKIEIVKQDIWLLSNDLKKYNRGFMSKVPDDSVVDLLIKLRELNIKYGCPIDGKDAEKNLLFVKRTRDIIKFIKNDRFLVFYNKDENNKNAVLGKGFRKEEEAKFRKSYDYVLDLDKSEKLASIIEKNPNVLSCTSSAFIAFALKHF